MKRELGIARCGLACCLCSENENCIFYFEKRGKNHESKRKRSIVGTPTMERLRKNYEIIISKWGLKYKLHFVQCIYRAPDEINLRRFTR